MRAYDLAKEKKNKDGFPPQNASSLPLLTLAVAERLGRCWIGCDLSKFAIQMTRKRLLDIHNSKDLMDE